MDQIRVARSFIAADALAEVIAQKYQLQPPVTCKLFSKLLRTQDNDHYLVTTGNGEKYVARVYQHGERLGRQESDYLFELDWLNYLKESDLPISYPIPQPDGAYLGYVNAPEGSRYYALFSLAQGEKMSLKDMDQLYVCGAEMARIHVVSNSFKTDHVRQSIDLTFLVDKPLKRIERFWADDQERADDLDLLMTSAKEARAELESLLKNEAQTRDGWGPIGGDFHNSSTYFDKDNQPTFFNFDLCGYGWRAYDIATFLLNTNLMRRSSDLLEAFFAGYYSVRPLSTNEHEAISPFLTIRRIWLTGAFVMSDGLAGHTFIAPA